MTTPNDGELTRMRDPAVEAAARVFEARLIVEAMAFGLSRVGSAAETPRLAAELNTLRQMANQASHALEALQCNLMLLTVEGNC
jgi:hypothetical protein